MKFKKALATTLAVLSIFSFSSGLSFAEEKWEYKPSPYAGKLMKMTPAERKKTLQKEGYERTYYDKETREQLEEVDTPTIWINGNKKDVSKYIYKNEDGHTMVPINKVYDDNLIKLNYDENKKEITIFAEQRGVWANSYGDGEKYSIIEKKFLAGGVQAKLKAGSDIIEYTAPRYAEMAKIYHRSYNPKIKQEDLIPDTWKMRAKVEEKEGMLYMPLADIGWMHYTFDIKLPYNKEALNKKKTVIEGEENIEKVAKGIISFALTRDAGQQWVKKGQKYVPLKKLIYDNSFQKNMIYGGHSSNGIMYLEPYSEDMKIFAIKDNTFVDYLLEDDNYSTERVAIDIEAGKTEHRLNQFPFSYYYYNEGKDMEEDYLSYRIKDKNPTSWGRLTDISTIDYFLLFDPYADGTGYMVENPFKGVW